MSSKYQEMQRERAAVKALSFMELLQELFIKALQGILS